MAHLRLGSIAFPRHRWNSHRSLNDWGRGESGKVGFLLAVVNGGYGTPTGISCWYLVNGL